MLFQECTMANDIPTAEDLEQVDILREVGSEVYLQKLARNEVPLKGQYGPMGRLGYLSWILHKELEVEEELGLQEVEEWPAYNELPSLEHVRVLEHAGEYILANRLYTAGA